MQRTFLLRQLLLCCLFMLGGISFADAQRPPRPGISGPFASCVGNTDVLTVNNPFTFPGLVYSYTWSLNPSSAGTVLSTTNTGSGSGTATIQWHTAGSVVITATSTLGEVFNYTLNVGAIPEPILTTDVLLACQPLSNDPKEEQKARFTETVCQWVCENSTVKYTVAGSPGSTYTWTATGATSVSPAGNDCYVAWGSAGNGMVTVTETTTSGCKASKSMCVKIQEGPTARFKILNSTDDPVVICRGGTVLLQDLSLGTAQSPIVSWHWDFGDGQVSNQSPGGAGNPITHQYDIPDEYKITLTVTNSCGCTDQMTLRVIVKDGRAPVITCPRVVCEGERAEYFVDIPCDPHSWDVEGGSIVSATDQSVVIVWDHVDPATGFGLIKYTACRECEMTAIEPVPVVVNNAKIQGLTNVCVGQEYVYRLPKWPTTQMNWYIASGLAYLGQTDQRNEIVVVPTGPGTIVLGCNYYNTFIGCEGAADITIQANPQAVITGSQLVCKGQSATYSASGYYADWVLSHSSSGVIATGSGTTFTPPAFNLPGAYTLTATGSTFCPADDYVINVKDQPNAPSFITGPDGACPGVPVKYSAGPAIAGTTFLWSVSSGSVNSATGPESYITFTGTPNYTISVQRITADAAQCASAAITKIVTDPMPALSVSGPATVCHSTTQTYGESYGGADSYEWSISPANLGSVINPNGGIFGGGAGNIVSILWNVPPGTGANAKIYVKVRKCNTTRIDSFNVFVRGVPTFVARLRSGAPDTTVCSGSPVNLQLVPSYAVSSVDSVTWQWGDGSQNYPGPAFAGIYAHVYNTNGASSQSAFQPVVTIKNPNGCLGTVTATGPVINVKPAPVAYISPAGPIAKCGAFTQQLTATLTTGIGGSNTFAWSPSGPNSPFLTTSSLGLYSVVVSSSNGCSSTSNIVEIKDGCPKVLCGPGASPAITLSGSNVCGAINVNAAVTGPVMYYQWFYPNTVTPGAMTATSMAASVTQAGNYQFDYMAFYRNNFGDTCVVDSAITVLVPYMADMRYEIACNQAGGNYKVTLADRSSLYPGIGVNRTYYNASWTSLGSGLNTSFNVAGGTTNTYYMVIQDNTFTHPACTTSVTVTLPAFPVADFTLASNAIGCVGNPFNFWNQSQGANLSYLWQYGSAQSQGAEGGVVYSAPYNGPVTLTVTDQYGCVSSKSQTLTANANPYAGTLTAAPNPACQGTAVNLAYAPTAGGLMPNGTGTYTWYRENMMISNDVAPNNSFYVTEPGGYWIKATGIYGCESKTNTVGVEIKQVPLAVIKANAKQCVDVPYTLSTEPVPGATYLWSAPGMIIPTTQPSLTQQQATPGTYTYTVTVTLNGCSRTSAPFTLTVNPKPADPVASFDIECDPQYKIHLNASGPAGTYNWSNGGYGQTIETYQGGQYQVFYTDENGCKSSSQIAVPKDPREYLWIFPKGCFCKLRMKTFLIGPITPFAGWSWDEDGTPVSSGTGLMQLFYPNPGHTYTMTLDNGYCAVTSEPMHYDDEVCGRLGTNGMVDNIPMTAALTSTGTAMHLVPNPARETAAVRYSFTPGSHDRYIEVYDMIGRKLQIHPVTADRGELVLPVAEYAAGVYQVVMKENGVTVQQSKLSLTR